MSTAQKVTYDQFLKMAERGDFDGENCRRVELIEGEILDMSPTGNPHEALTERLTVWSVRSLPPDLVCVRIQMSIGLPELDSVPEPDVAWVSRQSYINSKPGPANVLLLIEVSDSSVRFDRGRKSNLYASAGIADYWVINVPKQQVEVRRNPKGGRYSTIETFARGDVAHPLSFPDVALDVDVLFADFPPVAAK